jgi:hypothetical protein
LYKQHPLSAIQDIGKVGKYQPNCFALHCKDCV